MEDPLFRKINLKLKISRASPEITDKSLIALEIAEKCNWLEEQSRGGYAGQDKSS